MGSSFDNWGAAEGAIYMGANSSWEVIWTLVALAICIYAMIAGSRHELNSYKKVEGKGKK